MAAGARLGPDAWGGLHEQLLQLKMQNSELEEGNRPLRALVAGVGGPGPAGRAAAAGARASAAAHPAPPAAAPAGRGAADAAGGEEDGAEEARQEVVSLHQRLRRATEELAAARSEMRASQQAAMVAQTAAAKAAGFVPDLGEVRRRLAASDDPAELPGVPDAVLLRIATASFRLAPRPEPLACGGGSEQGPGRAPGASGPGGPAAAQEDRNMLALQRIQSQQKDLERLRVLADAQQATVKGLQEQAATCRASQAADKQQLLEDKLRTTERHALDLARRLGAAGDASGQAFELQCHLRAMADKVQQREQAIEKTRALRERQDASLARRRESLALALEDARGHQAEREEARASRAPRAEGRGPGGSAAPAAAAPAAAARASVGAQADLGASGPEVGLEELEAQLQTAQEERAALERRSAAEVQELRGLVRSRQRLQQAAAEAAAAAEAGGGAAGAAELPDGRVVGSLYNQKILELEELNAGLDGDLQLLRASLQCLRADLAAKEDLISDLMRSAVGAGDRPAAPPPKKDGVLSQLWGLSGLKDDSRRHHEAAEHAELKRLAEAACLDNMRLRRDLQSIGEELRKTVEGQSKDGAER